MEEFKAGRRLKYLLGFLLEALLGYDLAEMFVRPIDGATCRRYEQVRARGERGAK